MPQWDYLELIIEGIAWLDSLGRSGQLPLVGDADALGGVGRVKRDVRGWHR